MGTHGLGRAMLAGLVSGGLVGTAGGFPCLAYPVLGTPTAVVLADINGDGALDAVYASSWPSTLTVALGDGRGRFREPVFTPFETFLFDIVAADFNRDGLDDLAYLDTDSTNGDERIGVMLGQADGTLAPAGWRGLGQRPNDLRAIDLDGDGRDELVIAVDERFRSVRVARVGVDGSLTTPLAYFSGENAEEVAGGDVDGDGAIDLVCVNEDIDAMHVLLGDGSGGFEIGVPMPAGPRPDTIAVGDLNADGYADAVVGRSFDRSVSVYLADGTGGLVEQTRLPLAYRPTRVAIEDFDADGVLDIAVLSNELWLIDYLRGLGDGTFASPRSFGTGRDPTDFAFGDINDDGLLDALISDEGDRNEVSRNAVVLRGVAGEGFESPDSYSSTVGLAEPGDQFIVRGYAVGDIDLDGSIDAVVALEGYQSLPDVIAVHSNDGSGGLSEPEFVEMGNNPTHPQLTDLNGDGRLDLLAILRVSFVSTPKIGIRLGQADGFGPLSELRILGSTTADYKIGDVTGDGIPDIVAAATEEQLQRTISVFVGRGDGTFEEPVGYSGGNTPFRLSLADLDSDGDLDIAQWNASGTAILVNEGGGFFAAAYTVADDTVLLGVNDIDQDGDVDLIVSPWPGFASTPVFVLKNDGSLRFSVGPEIVRDRPISEVRIDDLNGDLRPDLVLVQQREAVTTVLYGQGEGRFGDRIDIAGSGFDVQIADMDADGLPDLVKYPLIGGTIGVWRNESSGCGPGDLVQPFGRVTFADVTAFLVAFNRQDAAADLAEPFGAFTFADLSAFLAAFANGCP